MTDLLGSPDGLTPGWLSAALGADVRSLASRAIGTGQTSSTYRLTIDADGCPPTLVAKFADGEEEARRRVVTGHRSEVGFYQHLVGTLHVQAPKCFYAAISDDGASFTLLLEDLAPREPGRQVDGCTFAQAASAVRNLARLHASRWNDGALLDLAFLNPMTEERAHFLADLTGRATSQFVERYADRLSPEDVTTLRDVADVLAAWQMNRSGPFSVVHGDYRLDNLMIHPEKQDVVAVDWQTATVALPARDLGYFLGTSLPVERRRAEEEQLLSCYHEELTAGGVEGYTTQRCASDYRRGQLHGPMITVLGSMTSARSRAAATDDMFLSMARRSCAAVRDHRSFETL